MSRSAYVILVLLLGVLTALPAVSVDTALPALPQIAKSLGADPSSIQLTLAAYFYGAAAGQLILAPLSDRFGRKPALYGGLAIYVVGGLGSYYATSVEMLCLLRFVQGTATYAGRIIPRAMVRDLYDREEAARLISYMMMIGGIAPIIAPLAGAYFSSLFGWRAVFAVMVVFGVFLMLLSVFFLKETLPPERRLPLNPETMAANLMLLMRSRIFLSYGLCVFLIMGALMAFLTSTSSIVVIFLQGSPEEFAWASAMVMVGYAGFSFVSGRIVVRVGIDRMIAIGSFTGAISGLTMLVLAIAEVNTLWAIMFPMLGVMIALSFVMPAGTAGALSPFGHMAGSAMANFGFIQTCVSATVSAVVGFMFDGTQMPMVIAIGVFCGGLIFAYWFCVRPLGEKVVDR